LIKERHIVLIKGGYNSKINRLIVEQNRLFGSFLGPF